MLSQTATLAITSRFEPCFIVGRTRMNGFWLCGLTPCSLTMEQSIELQGPWFLVDSFPARQGYTYFCLGEILPGSASQISAESASAGNRAWIISMASMYYTAWPLMLLQRSRVDSRRSGWQAPGRLDTLGLSESISTSSTRLDFTSTQLNFDTRPSSQP